MVFLCADTHGTDYCGKVKKFFSDRKDVTKDDYLIILGDAAVCWDDGARDALTKEMLQSLPVTVLFIDGNHENFDVLNDYGVDEWHGGKVHRIDNDIIHLMRGQVFEIDGISFFTMGGAHSYNKEELMQGLQWWENEIPSEVEVQEGWSNLEKIGFQVDYVITHSGPYEVVSELGFGMNTELEIYLARQLQKFADAIEFRDWYFGHFHIDEDIENYHCIMEEIIEL